MRPGIHSCGGTSGPDDAANSGVKGRQEFRARAETRQGKSKRLSFSEIPALTNTKEAAGTNSITTNVRGEAVSPELLPDRCVPPGRYAPAISMRPERSSFSGRPSSKHSSTISLREASKPDKVMRTVSPVATVDPRRNPAAARPSLCMTRSRFCTSPMSSSIVMPLPGSDQVSEDGNRSGTACGPIGREVLIRPDV